MGKINPTSIPEHITVFQAGYIERAVMDYFRDPIHQEQFETWRKARRERNEKKGIAGGADSCSLVHSGIGLALRA